MFVNSNNSNNITLSCSVYFKKPSITHYWPFIIPVSPRQASGHNDNVRQIMSDAGLLKKHTALQNNVIVTLLLFIRELLVGYPYLVMTVKSNLCCIWVS